MLAPVIVHSTAIVAALPRSAARRGPCPGRIAGTNLLLVGGFDADTSLA